MLKKPEETRGNRSCAILSISRRYRPQYARGLFGKNSALALSKGRVMHCRGWLPAIILSIVGLLECGASAAIVSRDFAAANDGLLTFDTINRREWFDLVATTEVTVDELNDLLSPGGVYDGFQFASLSDVESLALSTGFERIDSQFGIVQDFSAAYDLINAVSGVQATGGLIGRIWWWTSGLISDGLSTLDYQHVSVLARPGEEIVPGALNQPLYSHESIGEIWTTRAPFSYYPINPALGFWLYRNAAIPEPTTVGMCAIGLCLLASHSTRRRPGNYNSSSAGVQGN